ncbi:MAG: DUF5130 family protein [Actinomycetes bacterium]
MSDGNQQSRSAFTEKQTTALERTLLRANANSGLIFRVYVGPLDVGRASALAIHRDLPSPDLSVLIAVDPGSRAIEIVTGVLAKEQVEDQSCRLASLTMASRFAIGDIAAGLRDGANVLAEHARALRVLHTNEPEGASS